VARLCLVIALQLLLGVAGGWPMLLISLASPTQWGAPSFAPLAKGGSRKRRHQVGSITCAQQNHIAQAAWPPTLAKNARMGHPQRERCTQRSIKAGPPAFITMAVALAM
jgi:hypothetical protein